MELADDEGSSCKEGACVTEEEESAETLADRRKVQEGYELVNAIWKTQGAAVALRYCHHLPHGRARPL